MPKYEVENWGDIANTIFAKGVITAVDSGDDTADVTVDGYQDGSGVPLFYHCEPDSAEASNGSIEGAAAGFSVDDEVIVMCTAAGAPVRIVGFVDGIKTCCIGYHEPWDGFCLPDPPANVWTFIYEQRVAPDALAEVTMNCGDVLVGDLVITGGALTWNHDSRSDNFRQNDIMSCYATFDSEKIEEYRYTYLYIEVPIAAYSGQEGGPSEIIFEHVFYDENDDLGSVELCFAYSEAESETEPSNYVGPGTFAIRLTTDELACRPYEDPLWGAYFAGNVTAGYYGPSVGVQTINFECTDLKLYCPSAAEKATFTQIPGKPDGWFAVGS